MIDPERTHLITALHELTNFAEGLLEANWLLLEAMADETPRRREPLADAQRQHKRWVQQLAEFRKRLEGLGIEPPSRTQ